VLNPHRFRLAAVGLVVLVACPIHAAETPDASEKVVNYEAFGAVGDGKADDLPAIRDAHAHANRHGLPVRSKPGATYHLGRRAITAIISTDTDWGTSRFIIDDSAAVEDHRKALFEVRSALKPLPLKITRLKCGQTRLDAGVSSECLVYVENRNRRIFIRRGLNRNDGSVQKEVFILRQDGSIEGAIDWDYETVTRVEALPIDHETLFIRGGIFTNVANRMRQEDRQSGYWGRNLVIRRSKTVVDGVTHRVTGETDRGQPYEGFLNASRCARVMFRNCVIDGRKVYQKIGNAGKPVAMGTYGFTANLCVDFRMVGCRNGNDIFDRSRWGVIGTNFMKNILLEDCMLSRMDVHQGVSGSYVIRGTTLGHAGLNAIGRGSLIVENSTLHGHHLIYFRDDYGSTWDGTVTIRNCRWIPPGGRTNRPEMFGMRNDGTHDFGYPCAMPRVIRIDGLTIDDSGRTDGYQGIAYFGDPLGSQHDKRPFPYRLTERLEVSGLKIASGIKPGVSGNSELAKAVTLVEK
jgi:hypothetical protein